MLSSARWQQGFVISLDSLTITNLSQPRKISINEYLQGKRLTNTEKWDWTHCRTQLGKEIWKSWKGWILVWTKCWKEVKKKNHLGLKCRLKAEVAWGLQDKKKFLVKKWDYWISSWPAVEPHSRTRYLKRARDEAEHWLPAVWKRKKLCSL